MFFLDACYFSSACSCVGCFQLTVVWMSITFQQVAFSRHLFILSLHLDFCFSSWLSSQVSISFFIVSLQLFSDLLLVRGGGVGETFSWWLL